ncbi:glucosylceramidase [Vibrio navarrensis]|uniref:GH116 family glycosyl hydrolase n=1 Tax=Vibrio navarrensis TaxID=29495 RepID=UPI0018665B4C|nr:GH116 family glycosyl hydrolase [Vibrio navarrensis]MBE3666546.1 glucosylceramidase [Vibrio navarrensis]
MKNKIPYTTYHGIARDLCAKGDAVEFIQPWYTPVSTTPENTGMAVGGIGSTFTLTPKGETPNFSFIPGVYVDCSECSINFNDFYISVMEPINIENIAIRDLEELKRFLHFYPALFNGQKLDCVSEERAIEIIKKSLISSNFYSDNQSNFLRWKVEFTEKTQKHIEQDATSLMTQLLVAMDFFDGLLINASADCISLTGKSVDQVRSMNSENIHYQALYPIAQYQYAGIDTLKVTRKVVSPIVKNEQKLCSLPLHWNQFELTNLSDCTKLITLAQPLENLLGSTYEKARHGVQDSACYLIRNAILHKHSQSNIEDDDVEFIGASLRSDSPYSSDIEGEVQYGVVARKADLESGKITVTVKPSVYSSKVETQLINALKTGRTSSHFDRGIYSGRESVTALVCVQVELQPGETVDLRYLQVMDHSKIWLDDLRTEKAYTNFFPKHQRATWMIKEVLSQLDKIEEKIVKQQNDFLSLANQNMQNKETAERYSTMAMNTLSFLSESTVWDCENRFLVKECVDYPFFNSLDVYFYGSFSILYLLPELDGSVMQAFADAILSTDDTKRRYWEYEDKPFAELNDAKYEGPRALYGAVIHDLGSPFDIKPDAYSWHNVKEWKDLAPKFILMVYRHYQQTKNKQLVEYCWLAVKESIHYLSSLIEEGDSLPLVHGTDDTFDNLSSHGISIYCASLWAAGLKAAGELAHIMQEPSLAEEYKQQSQRALSTIENSLWDEQKGYYHFYATPIQTKHLTGKDYQPLEALGIVLTGDLVTDKSILNAYLDRVGEQSDVPRIEQRLRKKQKLLATAPLAFTRQYQVMILDSDNSFGDALVADTYLKLVGLEGLFQADRIERTLEFIYERNFLRNSPNLGVANMTLADGSPHDAFQAQDVWGGIQFSVATALKYAGKKEYAERLLDTVYHTLYHSAKIPFAAPEGFNCSFQVTSEQLQKQFSLSEEVAAHWLDHLISNRALRPDQRVSHDLLSNKAAFLHNLAILGVGEETLEQLYHWLLSCGMKYTAGRYFRPGMIFSYLYC